MKPDKNSYQQELSSLTQKELAIDICKFLESKKALKILLLDLRKVNSSFDFFLISSTTSTLHLESLVQDVRKRFAQYISSAKSISGNSHSGWIILDLFDLVIHFFIEKQRDFYKLDRLWGDGDIIYPIKES